MWGGRFSGSSDPLASEFTRSVEVDRELALDDLEGSIAHARGLERAGLLSAAESGVLVEGLRELREEVEAGRLRWDPALEDVHMNLEAALSERVGPVAGKLHTGRSRNDQVALDLRLWLRRTVRALDEAILGLERALVGLAEREGEAVMPGMTHLQPAQPVLLAHHLLAYVEMLERDRGRLADTWRRANRSPLGSGAVAGSGFAIDREAVARDLGLGGVTANSIDAVSDRDFAVEFLSAAAVAMVHLSRLAEELVAWSSPPYGWVTLDDAVTTGSSMMPNKKNPDSCELVRARAARVCGHLATMLGVLKGLPLAYNRDLQEDKEPLFDSAGVLERSLQVMARVVDTLSVDAGRMRAAALAGHTTATSVADALTELGVPFREAHRLVGRLVAEAERAGRRLDELPEAAFEAVLRADGAGSYIGGREPEAVARLRRAATLEEDLARPQVVGGTAPERVREALAAAKERLEREA